jgi:hypothetical protein
MFDREARYNLTVWTSGGGRVHRRGRKHRLAIQQALRSPAVHGGSRAADHSSIHSHSSPPPIDRWRTISSVPASLRSVGQWRADKGSELSGVRRQRSQYPEYLRDQDRYQFIVFRQCLVGTAWRLRTTTRARNMYDDYFRVGQTAYSAGDRVYQISRRPVFKSRPVES